MKYEVTQKSEWNPSMIVEDLQNTQKMCQALMQTPHYKKIGGEGIFAIVQKAKAMKLNPLEALNGGMYCVNGKVEMSANMMIQLCRQAGHSITKDKRSDNTVCILHGKRKDNGDTWTESFSIEDAKRAGLYKNTWEKFPRNMLFARALSNLARQLFPDVIGGCYVEGEISTAPPLNGPIKDEEEKETLTKEEVDWLHENLAQFPEIDEAFSQFMTEHEIESYETLPLELFEKIKMRLQKEKENLHSKEEEILLEIEEEENE